MRNHGRFNSKYLKHLAEESLTSTDENPIYFFTSNKFKPTKEECKNGKLKVFKAAVFAVSACLPCILFFQMIYEVLAETLNRHIQC